MRSTGTKVGVIVYRLLGPVLSFAVVCPTAAAQPASQPAGKEWVVVAQHGIVVTDSAEASEAGAEILRAGGNAIDAAAATSFALGVTHPYNSGMGGGGFLMLRLAATGEVFILDYRECAPRGATPDMFVKANAADPTGPPRSRFTGLAAAVPGMVAGHQMLLQRFGTRGMEQVLQPAIRLARDGCRIDARFCSIVAKALAYVDKYPALREGTRPLAAQFACEGKPPKEGTLLRQPEMARTLELLASSGGDAFYRGPIADAIVRTVRREGGILTAEDLAAYKPAWRQPIRTKYRDYEFLLMPPPSSGGICIAETLNILSHWDLPAIQRKDAALAAHLTVESLKHAFADRARYHGDADFVTVPVSKLTSPEYAAELAGRIREDAVLPPPNYGWTVGDDAGTTHFCVVDAAGNVVSATETINTSFGCLLVAEGTGIVLNDEMDDFTAEPGKPNAFGLRQSLQNAVAPGKRPLSCMTPTIVLANGKPVLAAGASGGPRIITATLQVMLNVLDYGQSLEQAVGSPRFHHQWQPDVVNRNLFAPDDPAIVGLAARGHKISDEKEEGIVQAVRIAPGKLTGASDPRKGGRPAGF